MIRTALSRLRRDNSGATIIEFAILAPAMFTMLVGVLQIGMGMQAYNALRGIASDTARQAVTAYQLHNDLEASEIQTIGQDVATAPPYGLQEGHLVLAVTQETTRVPGALEFEISVDYNLPSILAFVGIETIPITYSRPIFVVDSAAAP